MEPETKKSIRHDRAFWQRVAFAAITVGAIGNIMLGVQCLQYKTIADRWYAEATMSEEVKNTAMQALGEMSGKVQDLEAQLPVPTDAAPASRYAPITDGERDLLARLIYLEAGGASMDCQRACAEVVLNRVASEDFPDTVAEVIYDTTGGVQFSPAGRIADTTATAAQYEAVDAALYGEYLLDTDVVYFSTTRQNDNVAAVYDGVVFCRGYEWTE